MVDMREPLNTKQIHYVYTLLGNILRQEAQNVCPTNHTAAEVLYMGSRGKQENAGLGDKVRNQNICNVKCICKCNWSVIKISEM